MKQKYDIIYSCRSPPPLVSVVIPVYNAARTVAGCIASVQAQTLTDWECICVNDGSKDHTLEVLQSLAQKDYRIRIIDKPNGGVSSARNRGMDEARGETVFFLDADDTINPTCLEDLYNCRKKTSTNWCACNAIVYVDGSVNSEAFSDLSKRSEDYVIEKSSFAKNLSRIETWVVWGKVYDLKWLRQTGIRFNPALAVGEDSFFIYELLRCAEKVAHLGTCAGYNYTIVSSANNLRKEEGYQYPTTNMQILESISNTWNLNNPLEKCIATIYMRSVHSHTLKCLKSHQWNAFIFPTQFTWKLWTIATSRYTVFITWIILFLFSKIGFQKRNPRRS